MPIHSELHTNVYYDEVNSRILSAPEDAGAIREVLAQIRQELLDGTFPYRSEA